MTAKFKSITANLMVEDVDKTVSFYKDVLGFTLEMSVPRDDGKLQWAMVTRDAVELMLHEKGNLLQEVPQLRGSKMGGSLILFIEIEGFDHLYKTVEKHKELDFIKEPHTTFYGMKEFTIRDLNGYILTFAEPQEQENQ
ncbi:MAG TPA: VOC family protein [Halalkalibaculum sp.]|nr:VOC family protein [Halalkalibaculum sp.]